jgi:Uma2 family endonuclease
MRCLGSLAVYGGFAAGDLDHLPGLPMHTELIDGALIFRAPQTNFHTLAISLLAAGLSRAVPDEFRVRREMTVTLAERQRLEPDVLVVRTDSITGWDQADFHPDDVVLVAEVVSPDSEARDRQRKPRLYAAAAIPHFWRVENSAECPTVYVYELDPANEAYTLTGIHYDRLKLTVPFDIDIDLTEIDKL